MVDDGAFIAAIASAPDDMLLPLVYADWLDDRADPRGQLLRVWVELSWRASHASTGFRDLLAVYRRLWAASDPGWRRAFGAARRRIDARLAEELCRSYLRCVERRPTGQRGVIAGEAGWFPEPDEPYPQGWLVSYWSGRWLTDGRGGGRTSTSGCCSFSPSWDGCIRSPRPAPNYGSSGST